MQKVLIANRGEIAVRVIRACKEMGLSTVAVHSKADEDSLHVHLADESVCIGPAQSNLSYLSIPNILSAVELSGADAVHPGYGFLSENAKFARMCISHGVTFIGPKPDTIALLGDKIEARALAQKNRVPMLPGSEGQLEDFHAAKRVAEKIGYPMIIKAAAGGGGRGMKIVREQSELENAFLTATTEAKAAFGNGAVFIERYCEKPRHIEIQIAADTHGNAVAFGERDCTIQRRHQKLVEEAPSPVISNEERAFLQDAAVRLVQAADYSSVGTVEFLYDTDRKEFYFMEVNTRIQVEHPVTEIVTETDLIKLQINIARGEELPLKQKDVTIRGHAIECRINAEDPKTFAPWPGLIEDYHAPGGPGVRIDSMIYGGYRVPKYYDSMIAKLVTFGATREEARLRMLRCLDELKIEGIRTNAPFYRQLLEQPDFIENNYTTGFLNTWKATFD